MYNKLVSFGYDLGDGETIIDVALTDGYLNVDTSHEVRMPDSQKEATAIPTGFGYDASGNVVLVPSILQDSDGVTDIHAYFKRRPGDLLGPLLPQRYNDLVSLFSGETWPSQSECPEVYTPEFQYFKDSMTVFTDALFNDASFLESAKFLASDRDEIVFCVGHPTKWNKLDRLIYRTILRQSVLGEGEFVGRPASLLVAEESRAAYLYMREKARIENSGTRILPKGTCTLLIDIGSSTIDVTAVTSDSRNSQYNSGNNYLGVRSIDYIIRDWYLENLRKQPNGDFYMAQYQDLIEQNPTQAQALVLKCRDAKEKVYSTTVGKATVYFGIFPPAKLTREIIDDLAQNAPVLPVLQTITALPEEESVMLKGCSWIDAFKKLLLEQKKAIAEQSLIIGRIIMTGSATKMTFIPPIIREAFSALDGDDILQDSAPSRSISRGLSLVGPSNMISKSFQADMEAILDEEIPQIVAQNIPALADTLGALVEKIVSDIIRKRMVAWRNGEIKTINEMSSLIEQDCSEDNIIKVLNKSEAYNSAIERWAEDTVGKDIALKLQLICKDYNVTEFSLESLNVMKGIRIDPITGDVEVDVAGGILNTVKNVVSLICGLIAGFLVVDIAAAIVVIVAMISVDLAGIIFAGLMALGPVGWAILAAVLVISVKELLSRGLNGFKDLFVSKVQGYDLPVIARKLLSDKKINEQIEKAELKKKIFDGLLDEQNKTNIVDAISRALREQVENRVDDIKFVIEAGK